MHRDGTIGVSQYSTHTSEVLMFQGPGVPPSTIGDTGSPCRTPRVLLGVPLPYPLGERTGVAPTDPRNEI